MVRRRRLHHRRRRRRDRTVHHHHTAPGLAKLVKSLRRHQVAGVAIGRGDGPVVAALLDADLAVFVIASRQVTALRGHYGTAGNKDDRFDA